MLNHSSKPVLSRSGGASEGMRRCLLSESERPGRGKALRSGAGTTAPFRLQAHSDFRSALAVALEY